MSECYTSRRKVRAHALLPSTLHATSLPAVQQQVRCLGAGVRGVRVLHAEASVRCEQPGRADHQDTDTGVVLVDTHAGVVVGGAFPELLRVYGT